MKREYTAFARFVSPGSACAGRHRPKVVVIMKFSVFEKTAIHHDSVRCLTKSESKEATRPLVLTWKNLVRASGLSFFV